MHKSTPGMAMFLLTVATIAAGLWLALDPRDDLPFTLQAQSPSPVSTPTYPPPIPTRSPRPSPVPAPGSTAEPTPADCCPKPQQTCGTTVQPTVVLMPETGGQ